jgi:hypothetical protein
MKVGEGKLVDPFDSDSQAGEDLVEADFSRRLKQIGALAPA